MVKIKIKFSRLTVKTEFCKSISSIKWYNLPEKVLAHFKQRFGGIPNSTSLKLTNTISDDFNIYCTKFFTNTFPEIWFDSAMIYRDFLDEYQSADIK